MTDTLPSPKDEPELPPHLKELARLLGEVLRELRRNPLEKPPRDNS